LRGLLAENCLDPNCQESRMRSSVIAIVLCIAAASAAAQCASKAPVAQAARPGTPELIKTATAGTHPGQALAAEDGPPAISQTATAAKSDDKPHRGAGAVMLLAAVAVMSGIVLRRYIARLQ
jgi:hypothetical protein